VVFFRVVNPEDSVVKVLDHVRATSQIAQTTLRNVLGQSELDELLIQREKLNQMLQKIIDEHTDPWGVKVSTVEIKEVELTEEMKRSMAAQAEAERERRAKIINAEGELQASEKMAQAAAIIGREPSAIQLRFLSTLTEISSGKSNTIIFPIPMEFLKAFGVKADVKK
jgi:regulator of protease activity HflC (stomatin/prohibitin superfamily)